MSPHLTVGEIITTAKQKTLQERFLVALKAIYHAEKAFRALQLTFVLPCHRAYTNRH